MAHELQSENDLVYAKANKSKVWHGLGIEVDQAMTVDEVFEHPSLNYRPIKVPLYYQVNGENLPSERCAIIDPQTGQEFGTCKSRYRIIHNDSLKELLAPIVSEKEGIIETAGKLRGGQKFFAAVRLAGDLVVKGEQTEKYLIFVNSFDGSTPLQVLLSTILPVCANTVGWAINGAKKDQEYITVRHTANAESNLNKAAALLGIANKMYEDFQNAAIAMAEKKIKLEDAHKFISMALPKTGTDDDNGQEPDTFDNIEQARRNLIAQFEPSRKAVKAIELLETGNGQNYRNRKGVTVWSAFNAITECIDHYTNYKSPDARFEHALLDASGSKAKRKAWGMALQLVK